MEKETEENMNMRRRRKNLSSLEEDIMDCQFHGGDDDDETINLCEKSESDGEVSPFIMTTLVIIAEFFCSSSESISSKKIPVSLRIVCFSLTFKNRYCGPSTYIYVGYIIGFA